VSPLKIGQRRAEEIMDIRDAMQNGIGIDALRAVSSATTNGTMRSSVNNQRPTMKALRSRKKNPASTTSKATGGGPSRASRIQLFDSYPDFLRRRPARSRNGTEKLGSRKAVLTISASMPARDPQPAIHRCHRVGAQPARRRE